MSKKSKNKNRNYQPNPQPVNNTSNTPVSVTDNTKLEIEIKSEEMAGIEAPDEVSKELAEKMTEAEKRDDLTKYWNMVRELHKKYDYLLTKTEEERSKILAIREDLDANKANYEKVRSEFDNKVHSFSKREQELTEREFAIANNEYTGILKSLIDSLKANQVKIFTDTENMLVELTEFHKKNLTEFSDYYEKNAELEKQRLELKRDRKIVEIDKKIFEENIREEYDSKYSGELILQKSEFELIQRKIWKIEEENAGLKQLRDDLLNAFNTIEPSEILVQHSTLKSELSALKNLLNERPENYELEIKQAKIEELQAKISEFQDKVKEGELLELKRILNNMDTYIIEINTYKNQIESANIREASLKKTISDLSSTIDQLKGEAVKKSQAFEYAKKYDTQEHNYGINHLENVKDYPESLFELAKYLQYRMAHQSEKPFYYSLDTIRLFMAGLHMSPITILQGISGTGKTSLPREFSKALVHEELYTGMDSENQSRSAYRICAIQSGWRDNMDLMGYFNSFENKYKETDFFKAIYLANMPKYQDTLFFIILDEMNLSRPEHYFADFLSILEQAPSERYISLVNTPEEAMPNLIKGGKLKIPENIRFIGTANHDETTVEFAPKTYDRSNILEMPKNHPKPEEIQVISNIYNVKYSWLTSKYDAAQKNNTPSWKKFEGFINNIGLKVLLDEKGLGIGNRFEDQSQKFISVFVESGRDKERDTAIAADHLVTSRLLRTLKNRYDLDKNNLTKFKEDYAQLFKTTFKHAPFYAIELLDSEIGKK